MISTKTLAVSLVALALAPACTSTGDPEIPQDEVEGGTTISTDKGAVQGAIHGATREFLGVPYAAPPLGALRWKAPQPEEAWSGVRDATTRGPMCLQFVANLFPLDLAESEDCLTLNVWSPKVLSASPSPVMLWIHGGGFASGGGGEGIYDGRALSEATGMVVVTVNYRLGPLGFLAHSALSAESGDHPASGNYGLEDQRAAMVWVKKNIAAFGGDPENVTLFGQSAGGASVCWHVASPRSGGQFDRAIISSGSCSLLVHEKEDAETAGATFATRLGCEDPANVIVCLRDKSVEDIVREGTLREGDLSSGAAWGPVVDGVNVAKHPQALLEEGEFNKVPILLGTVRDEGTLFVRSTPDDLTEQGYQELLQGLFGPAGPVVLARYPASDYASPKAALVDLITDSSMVCPVRRVSRAVSKGGSPTFLYTFTHEATYPDLPGFGVFHASELAFLFGNPALGIEFTKEDQQMSESMMGYWSRFAKQGDPNDDGQPAWPAYDASSDQHIELRMPGKAASGLKREKCDFWDLAAR